MSCTRPLEYPDVVRLATYFIHRKGHATSEEPNGLTDSFETMMCTCGNPTTVGFGIAHGKFAIHILRRHP